MKRLALATTMMILGMRAEAATYELAQTPQTVAWGHYDATSNPDYSSGAQISGGDRGLSL